MSNVGYDPSARYYRNTMSDMQCYDSLPAPLRQAVANAPYQYSAEQVLNHWLELKISNAERQEYGLAQSLARAYRDAYTSERLAVTPMVVAFAPYKRIGY